MSTPAIPRPGQPVRQHMLDMADAPELDPTFPYHHAAECSEILADDLQDRSTYMQGWRWGAICGATFVCVLVLGGIALGTAVGWLQ